jgi:hypothetical protein
MVHSIKELESYTKGDRKMKRTTLLTVLGLGLMIVFCGCASKMADTTRTGFLSDYSKLKSHSDVSYRYVGPNIGRYSKFIIDPVKTHFHTSSKASDIPLQKLEDMRSYMNTAVVNAISERYTIVYQPGPGIARMRIAITDLKKSKVLQNIHPASKLMGSGLGGASIEMELIDSQTGAQLGAVMESQLGSRLSLDGVSSWGDAKAVMDDWAKRIRARLDEARTGS